MINKLLSIGCFLSPFLIGYGIYKLLKPVGFWQITIWFVIAFLICLFEGLFAYTIGIALWEVD